MQEFEAQEQLALMTAQLEEEKQGRQLGMKFFLSFDYYNKLSFNVIFGFCILEQERVKELQVHKENMDRISKKVSDEVEVLKNQCDREKENARLMKLEADRVSQ